MEMEQRSINRGTITRVLSLTASRECFRL